MTGEGPLTAFLGTLCHAFSLLRVAQEQVGLWRRGGVHEPPPHGAIPLPALDDYKGKGAALPASIANARFVIVGLLTGAGLLALFFFSFFFPF